jgi:glucosamine--fructose-6-phosphate aminotransferase (isomerizing)
VNKGPAKAGLYFCDIIFFAQITKLCREGKELPVEKEIYENIKDLPRVYEWATSSESLKELEKAFEDAEIVYFVGCGSSHHLLLAASKYLTGILKKDSKVMPAGEVLFARDFSIVPSEGKLAVLMSRSGETTETVMAAEKLKSLGMKTVGITLEKGSSLEKASDIPVVLPVREESVVMTKSFGATLLSLQIAVEKAAGLDKSEVYEGILKDIKEIYEESREDALRFTDGDFYVFLGVGPYEGIAREGALKLEEMSLTRVEAMSAFEYRHGPKSLVEEGVHVVIYSDGKEEKKLAEELEGYGGKVMVRKRLSKNYEDMFAQTIFAQMLGLNLAKRKGVNVENPRNLTKVVKI